MDRSWIHEINRVSQRFKDGVIQFLDVARNCLNSNGETLCPCRKCANILMQTLPAIQAHICTYGFLSTYIVWNKHGELGHVAVEYSDSSSEFEGIEAAIHDAVGPNYVHVENATNVAFEEMNDGDQRRYDKMFEELNCGLYEGCTKFSSLEFIIKLMHIKVLNKWSDHSFNMLLELLADAFPTNNRLPRKLGEVKRLLVNVGLGYQTYDVCKYDCFVFMGEDAGKEECPVCHEPRYVRKNEKTKVPHKRLFHFPITPRLKRLFASRKTAKDMRWHHDCHDDDGDLSHPSDAEAWKHVDNLYPDFAADCRNVRLALASDGFNPFGQMSSKYSVWPVILTPYNIPTWKLMKQSFMFLSLLIPGPKSPGKDFDVFMRPLIKELKELWDVGVTTYDAYKKEIFNLRAMVIWTISDFSALAYLSGWSTCGYKACLICGDDTLSVGIICKRCYIGARRCLGPNHRWHNSKEFDGFPETRGPLVELSWKEIVS